VRSHRSSRFADGAHKRRCHGGLLAAGALWLATAPPAQAQLPRFVFGRSAAVFQQNRDSVATRIGAWLDGSWVDNDRKPDSVDLNHANLFLDARWRDLQGFLEVEYERETGLDGDRKNSDFEVEQAYLRFRPRDELSVRAGRFNTPTGIWLPIHWAILMDTIGKPPHATKDLLPEQQVGLELAGRIFPERLASLDGQLDYSLFVGAGGDRIGQDDVHGVTAGGDLRLRLRQRYLIGASAYHQKNDRAMDRSEQNVLVYGQARLPGALTFRTEYLHQWRERPDGAIWSRNLDVGYAKLRWDFARWFYANYRVSYGDDDRAGRRTTEQLVNTFTLGIQPYRDVRIKLEYSVHDFNGHGSEDFRFWGTSLGVRF